MGQTSQRLNRDLGVFLFKVLAIINDGVMVGGENTSGEEEIMQKQNTKDC